MATLLGWASGVWRAVIVVTLALAVRSSRTLSFDSHWWLLVRDLLIALAPVAAAASVLALVHRNGLDLEVDPLSRWGFPDVRIAGAARGHRGRSARSSFVLRGCSRCGSSASRRSARSRLGALARGRRSPGSRSGSARGARAAGLWDRRRGASGGRVRAAVTRLASRSATCGSASANGSARRSTSGTTPTGRPLKVRVLGRDAQDTQRLARRWRLLAYRDPPRSAPVGRLEQVEHEAVATLMAAQAGVRVPEWSPPASAPTATRCVVTRQPDVEPLELAEPRPGERRDARGAVAAGGAAA